MVAAKATNARRQQHLQLAEVSRKLSVVPRGLAQLNYHNDVVPLVPAKGLVRAITRWPRVALFLVCYKTLVRSVRHSSRLTAFQRAKLNVHDANALPQLNNQFFACPRPTRPPHFSESPFGQEAESEQYRWPSRLSCSIMPSWP